MNFLSGVPYLSLSGALLLMRHNRTLREIVTRYTLFVLMQRLDANYRCLFSFRDSDVPSLMKDASLCLQQANFVHAFFQRSLFGRS